MPRGELSVLLPRGPSPKGVELPARPHTTTAGALVGAKARTTWAAMSEAYTTWRGAPPVAEPAMLGATAIPSELPEAILPALPGQVLTVPLGDTRRSTAPSITQALPNTSPATAQGAVRVAAAPRPSSAPTVVKPARWLTFCVSVATARMEAVSPTSRVVWFAAAGPLSTPRLMGELKDAAAPTPFAVPALPDPAKAARAHTPPVPGPPGTVPLEA